MTSVLKKSLPVVFLRKNNEYVGVVKLLKNEEDIRLERLSSLIPANSTSILYTNSTLLITHYVQPASTQIKNFADFLSILKDIPFYMLLYVLYQLFTIFASIHTQNPTFAHNDCKVDNILLTTDLKVVLIDAETCTGESFPPLKINAPKHTLQDFGLGLPWSAWTDMHLILLEVWTQIKKQKPAWAPEFLFFLSSILPMSCMKTYAENSPYVSVQNRLNKKGRDYLGDYTLDTVLKNKHFARFT